MLFLNNPMSKLEVYYLQTILYDKCLAKLAMVERMEHTEDGIKARLKYHTDKGGVSKWVCEDYMLEHIVEIPKRSRFINNSYNCLHLYLSNKKDYKKSLSKEHMLFRDGKELHPLISSINNWDSLAIPHVEKMLFSGYPVNCMKKIDGMEIGNVLGANDFFILINNDSVMKRNWEEHMKELVKGTRVSFSPDGDIKYVYATPYGGVIHCKDFVSTLGVYDPAKHLLSLSKTCPRKFAKRIKRHLKNPEVEYVNNLS